MYLAKWNILKQKTFQGTYSQAQRIRVDSKNSIMLVSEKNQISLIVTLLPEIVAIIVLSAMCVLSGFVYVLCRGRAQSKVDVLQSKKANELETKEVELAKRENELSTKIEMLKNEKNILLKEQKGLENVAKKRKVEFEMEEKKFMKLAIEETKELDILDAKIDSEHTKEAETLDKMLSDEATNIMKQLKSQGSSSSEIALDAESVDHQLQSMTIQAGTSAEQIQKDLIIRHEKMRARTLARNKRRQVKLAEKLNEQAREVSIYKIIVYLAIFIKIIYHYYSGSPILHSIYNFFHMDSFFCFFFF